MVNNAVVASWFASGSVRLYEQIINLPVHTWASAVTVRVRKQPSSPSGTAQIGYFNVRHSVPCNVPEPTSTPTPTMTPTPTPSWGEDGIVQIEFNMPIPEFENFYDPCERTASEDTRLSCSVFAYDHYRNSLGGSMTWGQFVSLVMYSEGNAILLGKIVNGTVELRNPQTSLLGTCWRLTGVDTWNGGEQECDTGVGTAPGVQRDFIYAVWEWVFQECARATGFTTHNGQLVTYEKNDITYSGECNEEGITNFLAQVQSLYQDTTFTKDPNLYLSLAESEYAKWHWTTTIPAPRYRYGVCPCTWGNVAFERSEDVITVLPADVLEANPNMPQYLSARRNNRPSINNGWSFSYFTWDLEDAPNPNYRYFKVY